MSISNEARIEGVAAAGREMEGDRQVAGSLEPGLEEGAPAPREARECAAQVGHVDAALAAGATAAAAAEAGLQREAPARPGGPGFEGAGESGERLVGAEALVGIENEDQRIEGLRVEAELAGAVEGEALVVKRRARDPDPVPRGEREGCPGSPRARDSASECVFSQAKASGVVSSQGSTGCSGSGPRAVGQCAATDSEVQRPSGRGWIRRAVRAKSSERRRAATRAWGSFG